MWRSGWEARGRDDLTVQNDSTLSRQRKRQFPIGVNPPPCPVIALLLLQLVYACLCLHVCVCHHFSLTFLCRAGRRWAELQRGWAANPIQKSIWKQLRIFFVFLPFFLHKPLFSSDSFRESACKSAGKKSCILNTGFLEKHPLVSSSSLFLSIANPWR